MVNFSSIVSFTIMSLNLVHQTKVSTFLHYRSTYNLQFSCPKWLSNLFSFTCYLLSFYKEPHRELEDLRTIKVNDFSSFTLSFSILHNSHPSSLPLKTQDEIHSIQIWRLLCRFTSIVYLSTYILDLKYVIKICPLILHHQNYCIHCIIVTHELFINNCLRHFLIYSLMVPGSLFTLEFVFLIVTLSSHV